MASHLAQGLGRRVKSVISASSEAWAMREGLERPMIATYFDSWTPMQQKPDGWPKIRGRGTATFGAVIYADATDDDSDDSEAYSIAQECEFLLVGWPLPLFLAEPTARFFDGGMNTEEISGGLVVVRVLFTADVTKTFRSPLAPTTAAG
jgi:hypothetical protein